MSDEFVSWQSDGSVSIRLITPVQRQNERVECLTLRRLKARDFAKVDFRAIESGDVAACRPLIEALGNLTPGEVGDLDAADYLLAVAQIGRLLQRPAAQLV